ncbi:MAG: hypothetical protein ILP12_04620 [Lachnospiraceae bacterium]|nr:hypothetical protein [Lachnospiraceae bacterium]
MRKQTGRREKKSGRRSVLLLLSAVLLSLLLSACGGEVKELREEQLISAGSSICSRAEMTLYLLAENAVYGGGSGGALWERQLPDGDFSSYIREAVTTYLVNLFLLDAAARREGIVLSEAEEQAVKNAADRYQSALGEERAARYGITYDVIRTAFARWTRAQLYYEKIMHEAIPEISEEEARAIRVQIIEIDKSLGIETARSILASLEAGSSVSEAIKGIVGVSTRKETVIRGTYGGDFDLMAFSLRNGQWSPVLTQEGGYTLVQCLLASVPEETAVNRRRMEQAAHEAVLREKLAEVAAETPFLINPAELDAIDIASTDGPDAVNFFEFTEGIIVTG